eukprot:568758-Amorphochlora_amoeboformis.AAC.1
MREREIERNTKEIQQIVKVHYPSDEYDDNDEMDSPDNENEREDDDYVTERRDTAHSHAHRFREASPDE